jgi:glucokinase
MTRELFGAVDLGGTKILTAVADAEGAWLGEDVRASEVERGPAAVIGRIVDSLAAAIRRAGVERRQLRALGVAAPGPIDVEHGIILEAPNMPAWHNLPLAAELSALLGVRAVLENDANAAALGEFVYGAGRGVRHMIYLTISTGIGGGLILDGRLYRGATGSAGELGHIVIDEHGPLCGCGATGCLEALASGTAMAAFGAEAVRRGEAPLLAKLAGGGEVTAEHVAAAAAEGEPASRKIIGTAAHALGLALSDFVNVFNPDLIVIGGGAARIGAPLLDPAVALMRARAFRGSAHHVRIAPATLGDRSVAAGAIALARAAVA